MPNYIFIILLAITTGYLTFLTTKGGLTDNRFTKPWNKLTNRGKRVFFTLIFIGILLFVQEWNTQRKSDYKDFLLKMEQDQRDSIITSGIKSGVDSNSKKLFDDISTAFSKQEFRLDTVKKDVERIRDSSKIVVNNTILPEKNPEVAVCADDNPIKFLTKNQDSLTLRIDICCKEAKAYNVYTEVYVVGAKGGVYYLFHREEVLSNTFILAEQMIKTPITLTGITGVNAYFLYIECRYKNKLGHEFESNDIYQFILSNKISGLSKPYFRNQIRNFLKKPEKR